MEEKSDQPGRSDQAATPGLQQMHELIRQLERDGLLSQEGAEYMTEAFRIARGVPVDRSSLANYLEHEQQGSETTRSPPPENRARNERSTVAEPPSTQSQAKN